MTQILLDTSAYSAFFRGHEAVVRRLQEASRIVVTPIVLGELRAGFAAGSRRENSEEELRRFTASPRVDLVPIDSDTSHRYAAIVLALRAAGTPIPTNDVWIAATAMQHGLRLLTTDAHYLRVVQVLVDYEGP